MSLYSQCFKNKIGSDRLIELSTFDLSGFCLIKFRESVTFLIQSSIQFLKHYLFLVHTPYFMMVPRIILATL